SQPSMRLRF
uniref:FMRFamide-like neuropeptide FLP4 n=1 Tax=Penaeus monodon TaxID=6687 RepID=FAR4_PENMO|nr:RecName: Full=FMRFamide-like neuropeptide FLP4; AltName: Full=SQPSMRLRF-amide [Penaeus monodon]